MRGAWRATAGEVLRIISSRSAASRPWCPLGAWAGRRRGALSAVCLWVFFSSGRSWACAGQEQALAFCQGICCQEPVCLDECLHLACSQRQPPFGQGTWLEQEAQQSRLFLPPELGPALAGALALTTSAGA